jgi:heat shock protein HtpX
MARSTIEGVRRRDLFPSDRRLQARMVLAAIGTPLFVIGALLAAVVLLPHKVLAGLALALVFGGVAVVREHRAAVEGKPLADGQEPELHAVVERLCLLADLPQPEIVLHRERQPNSWVFDLPRRAPRLHVTTGLLETLEPAELEAVIAHELSHVAHHDATVMTVVGLPGEMLGRGTGRGWGFGFLVFGQLVAAAVSFVASFGTRALSRHRELAADAGAARLTGHPAALASALRKVSGEIARVPKRDLRAVTLDAFGLLPTSRESATSPMDRLRATHPPLARRIAALERLERELHGARLAPPK